jgi:ribonuclease T2
MILKKCFLAVSTLGYLLGYLLGAVAWADSTPPTPGNFDSYVLAMSDENDFCAANPSKQECMAGAGALGMRLHGLWPDQANDLRNTYQYCSSVTAKQVSPNWCAANIDVGPSMDPTILSQLTTVMPGVDSCLENHEWYAHGTCSGMQVNDYFNLATTLASSFLSLPNFQGFISEQAGQTVSQDQLMSALSQDLGAQIGNAAILLCRKSGDQYHFQEVDITLNLQSLTQFPSPESLAQSKQDSGNCPDDGIILTAASQ